MSSTPEYKTLITLTPELRGAVQHDLVALGDGLVSKRLITPNQGSQLRNMTHFESDRAARLVELIQSKVQQNVQHYHTFVEVLESRGREYYGDILDRLHEVLQHHRDDCLRELVSLSQAQTSVRPSAEEHSTLRRRQTADDGNAKEGINSNLKVNLSRQDSQSHFIIHAGKLQNCCGLIFLLLVSCSAGAYCYFYGPWWPGNTNASSEENVMTIGKGSHLEESAGTHSRPLQGTRPQEGCTKIESSQVLFQELAEVGSWKHLCNNLGVSKATVNSLTYETAPNTERKLLCVEAFYREDTEPKVRVCWETVVRAVASYPISNPKLAKRIEN